ncbi:type 1 glutamine amidotransferase [Andreprevotia chitinilytica]|uniref:type 1 glutamine amidotransferase n=1 Tax=Andreprevotia chitinilytica TaxID=396808 RepID=UPI00054EA9A4|nr:type 1 glutamine amidotransferase [Andreprevotia chitinilytica]
MKPVAICRHHAAQGPGYLLDFFNNHDIPWRQFAIDAGEMPPVSVRDYSGVVILGSPASVNDHYGWMQREEALLRDALWFDRPILGHCFGGQLLAKTLGSRVRRNTVPHIGWGKVLVTKFDEAAQWFGPQRELELFHWHFDTFEIPRGAKRVLFGTYCMNKAFAYGKHLGLQSHLEVTAQSIRDWCLQDGAELDQYAGPSVQSEGQIFHRIDERITKLHRLADRVYDQWSRALDRPIQLAVRRPHGGPGWGKSLMA